MRTSAACCVALLLLSTAGVTAGAQSKPASKPSIEPAALSILPGIELPLETEKPVFEPLGGTGAIAASVPLVASGLLTALAEAGYTYAPVRAQASMSLVSVSVGAGLNYELTPQLILQASAAAGGFFGFFNSTLNDSTGSPYDPQSGFGFYVCAGCGASFYLTPVVSLDLAGSYHNYVGLSQGFRVQLGTSLHFAGFTRRMDLPSASFQPVFPSLLQYYQGSPVGSAVIRNGERFPLKNVQVSLFVKGLMDSPRLCATIAQLKPGESRTSELFALFTDRILDVKEDSAVAATITVDYVLNGRKQQKTSATSIKVFNRNASTWDDSRRVASFVSAKDAEVMRFAKTAAEVVKKAGPASVDLSLRMGMGLFDALTLFGMSYVQDPNTPSYEAASKDPLAVDFLQFPNQTLRFKGGDCDDLTILYTSLLEAVGVETAFITIPGHIYAAFSLAMTAEQAKKSFQNETEIIVRDGKAWVPVEITMVGKGFQEAWKAGSEEWHTNAGKADFFSVHAAWERYAAAGTPAGVGEVADLDASAFQPRYGREIAAFIDRELSPQVEKILALTDAVDSKLLNRLGVLYARYGKLAEAETTFQKILAQEAYLPALINLGNLSLLRGENERAASFFEEARVLSPDNSFALEGLTRANYGQGKLALATRYLASLRESDPAAAERLSFVSAGSQAGGAARAGAYDDFEAVMQWSELE